jgi:dihydroflavonol-4-reductase
VLAVFRGPLPEGRDYYDEHDWSDPTLIGLEPYPKSKIIAEKAAWDFIEKEGEKLELTVVNPSLVWGPPLSNDYSSSLRIIKVFFIIIIILYGCYSQF